MTTKPVLNTTIAALGLFVSATLLAAPDLTIARDKWLEDMKSSAPGALCHGFMDDKGLNTKMATAKIDFDQCVKLVPAIFDKCQESYYSVIPAVLKNESIAQWGSVLGQCVGSSFATTYFDKAPGNEPDKMTKEIWLSKFAQAAPALMCAELFKSKSVLEKLNAHHITYYKCLQLLPESISKCQTQLMPTIPATLNESDRQKWGDSMGTCIGAEFRSQHLG